MESQDRFEAQGESAAHLRDTLESAWDAGQAVADEKQVSADVVAAEIARRDPSDRELIGAAYDAGMERRKAREREIEAITGYRPDRPAEPADRRGIRSELIEQWNAATDPLERHETGKELIVGRAKATGAAPDGGNEAGPEKPETPAAPDWSDADRARLDKMTPEDRAWAEAKAAEQRAAYGGVDALAGKWGGYLSQIGADTPDKQIGALDSLLATERALRTGTPQEKAAILSGLAHQYGVGAPAPAAMSGQPHIAAQAPNAMHPLHQAALAAPLSSQGADHRERFEQAQKQIGEFAAETDEYGHPRHALMGAVMPEMMEAAAMLRQHGRPVDLPTVYNAAVQYAAQTRPEVLHAARADGEARLRAFQKRNPVAHEPRIVQRMTTLGTADSRLGAAIDPKTLLDRALKLEPEIAARQNRHAADEKARGFDTPRPSRRQLLEAGYSALEAA